MKKLIYFFLAATLFVGCKSSKDDDPTPEVNTEVTLPSLDNKAGGVYYAIGEESFTFFKLILKNGDDNMVCQIYDGKEKNGTKIITLIEKANAAVDKKLIHHEFNFEESKLIASITSSGVPSFSLVNGNATESLIVYKSKSKEPVEFYFDSDHKFNSVEYEGAYGISNACYLLQKNSYAFLKYQKENVGWPGLSTDVVGDLISGTIFNKSDIGFSFFSWENEDVDDSERTVKVTYQENGSLKGEYSNEESYGTYNFKKLFN